MSQADQFAKLGTAANETIRGRWQFSYCGGAAPSTDSCSTNNGNVMHQVISPLGMTQSYSYDEVNRLKTVVEQSSLSSSPSCTGATGESPCRKLQYDRWGNMGVEAAVRFSTDLFTPAPTQFNPFNQTTVNGAEYDAAGNQKKIGGYSRAYDAENRMVSSTLAGVTNTFAYDGEGRRVKKDSAVYVYDAQGRLAAEYGGSSTSVGTYYLTQDHLGSTRLVTDSAGAVVADGRHDYLPFGEQITAPINGRDAAGLGYPSIENATTIGKLPKLFTGKERDAETGLDFFGARYFSAAQGRFTSPDAPFADQHPANPQSWNLYSYARNNPLRYVDDDGEAVREGALVYKTYDVHGKTAAEARANALAVSGIKSPEGEAMMGSTSGPMKVTNMVVQPGADGFEGTYVTATETLVSADVQLNQTITMPNWVEKSQAAEGDQTSWNNSMTSLDNHEKEHVQIYREQAQKLDRSLPGTAGTGGAPTSTEAYKKAGAQLTKKPNQKVRANAAETKTRQQQHDTRTDHGRKKPDEKDN